MYPLHFANLFPPFARNLKVFVAMGFASQSDHRWEKVIKPAVNRVAINEIRLEAYRVDVSVVGDSILTEILQGITSARLILADISTLHVIDDTAYRNANVMYEVGIAHSLRLPEEVLLFRSDCDRLLFDLANVRVHHYDPDKDEEAASDKLAVTIIEALREVDLRKSTYVHRAAEVLDGSCVDLLVAAANNGGIAKQPASKSSGDILWNTRYIAAISRMLELGILCFENFKITPELLESPSSQPIPYEYRVTPFGDAVLRVLIEKTGLNDPDVLKSVEATFAKFAADSNPTNPKI
ncbi:MAG: hypothetical protein K1X74_23290 [Pirellulales bacterium]|nr:hypothetical protein [Pirellulales bacterium]